MDHLVKYYCPPMPRRVTVRAGTRRSARPPWTCLFPPVAAVPNSPT